MEYVILSVHCWLYRDHPILLALTIIRISYMRAVHYGQVYAHRTYIHTVRRTTEIPSHSRIRIRRTAVLHYNAGYGYPLIYRVFSLTRPQTSVVLPRSVFNARSEQKQSRVVAFSEWRIYRESPSAIVVVRSAFVVPTRLFDSRNDRKICISTGVCKTSERNVQNINHVIKISMPRNYSAH